MNKAETMTKIDTNASTPAAITLIEAITQALAYEMRNDDRVVVFGEDVGKKGGVFGATMGLFDEFGEKRCFDTPLSECGIIGAKYPQMDMVSFGPNIRGAHAPGERVEVASVGKAWQLLQAVLAAAGSAQPHAHRVPGLVP